MKSRVGWLAALASALLATGASCGLAGGNGGTGFGRGGGGSASTSGSGIGGGAGGGLAMSTGAGGKGAFPEMQCDAGQFIVGLDSHGKIRCADIQPYASRAINADCSAYLGWRDSCTSGCNTKPSRWGGSSGDACLSDMQGGDYCMATSLGNDDLHLAGIQLGSHTVDDNDRFYATLHCEAPAPVARHPLPCASGEAVVGIDGDALLCGPIAAPAVAFVKTSCALTLGWQDQCQPCNSAIPTAWGSAGDVVCEVGGGVNATCLQNVALGSAKTQLFTFNTQGQVNDDDDFYVGVTCQQPPHAASHRANGCAASELAIATHADGTVECQNIDEIVFAYFHQNCAVFLGWTDCSGSGCMVPKKWGYATGVGCNDGTPGDDDICIQQQLGESLETLYGLNLDDDADGDTLFIGLLCR